jgi:hypothetical protein
MVSVTSPQRGCVTVSGAMLDSRRDTTPGLAPAISTFSISLPMDEMFPMETMMDMKSLILDGMSEPKVDSSKRANRIFDEPAIRHPGW